MKDFKELAEEVKKAFDEITEKEDLESALVLTYLLESISKNYVNALEWDLVIEGKGENISSDLDPKEMAKRRDLSLKVVKKNLDKLRHFSEDMD